MGKYFDPFASFDDKYKIGYAETDMISLHRDTQDSVKKKDKLPADKAIKPQEPPAEEAESMEEVPAEETADTHEPPAEEAESGEEAPEEEREDSQEPPAEEAESREELPAEKAERPEGASIEKAADLQKRPSEGPEVRWEPPIKETAVPRKPAARETPVRQKRPVRAGRDEFDMVPHPSMTARKAHSVHGPESASADLPYSDPIKIERMEHTHHHRHRHRKGPLRRLRHWYRSHRITISIIILMILAAMAVGGYIIYKRTNQQKSQHITSSNSYDMGGGYRVISYEGRKYKYNNLITTVLYAGLDSSGEMKTYSVAGEAPRADIINLAVLDKKNKKMSVISISRYTLTRIRRYSMFLQNSDYYVGMLCYAFPFGDGGALSCENLTESVSNLLGVPVNEYVVTNLDSMTYINDIVGGVTVEVPNDDLAEKLPGVKKGSSLEITSDNVMTYLRTRDTNVHFSNDSRLERQKSYITAYVEKLQALLPDRRGEIWDKLDQMNRYLLTSVTKNKYIQYAKLLSTVDFSSQNYYNLPGENQRGMYYDEFVPDETGIRKLVIDLFYEPA